MKALVRDAQNVHLGELARRWAKEALETTDPNEIKRRVRLAVRHADLALSLAEGRRASLYHGISAENPYPPGRLYRAFERGVRQAIDANRSTVPAW